MQHNTIRHMLSEYIDETVGAHDKAEIEAHLKTCQKCSDALHELRKTVEHIKAVEEINPPAWMTQKIMEKVRAESEKKKSWFRRLFFPLHIKLPLEAVAMMFLAVTAFYIYQSIHPAAKHSEAPIQEFEAGKETPPISVAKNELGKADGSALRSKQVPQSPGYKALDMTREYEAPPAPSLQDKAAASVPSPAKPAERPTLAKEESVIEKRTISPKAAAPAMMPGQVAGAAPRPEVKLKSATPSRQALNAVSADKTDALIIVRVKDVEAAAEEVEQAIIQLGGSITKKENHDAKGAYRATINAQKLADFKNKLKLIGEVKDEAVAPRSYDGWVTLKIELVVNSAHP